MAQKKSPLEVKYPDDTVDITDIPKKTVVRDYFDDGVRVIILRANFSWTAYVGVPSDHPLAGFEYDDVNISCHGGLTYSGEGDDEFMPKGYYWYGWDYAHAGDYTWYDHNIEGFNQANEKKWSIKEVMSDAWSAAYDTKKLMKMCERVRNGSK